MEQTPSSKERDGTIEPSTGRDKRAKRLGEVVRRMTLGTKSDQQADRNVKPKVDPVHGLERPGYIIMPGGTARNAPDVKRSVDEIGKAMRESNYREIFPAAMEEMAAGDPVDDGTP